MKGKVAYMEIRIVNYINELFKYSPKTPQAEEVKNEIISNTVEKYKELKEQGKDDETAYQIAVSYIGNVSELIGEYSKDKEAVELKESYQKHKARQALLLAISVSLYIMSVVPVIILSQFGLEIIGVCGMFAMVAIATGLIIYRASTNKLYTVEGRTPPIVPYSEPMSYEAKRRSLIRKNILSAGWTLVVALYLLISFITGAWHITWIMFVLAGACDSLAKAVFDYNDYRDLEDDKSDD